MSVRMPWGKHRGLPLEKVPQDYLHWVLRSAEAADDWLKARIREELDRRSGRSNAQAESGATNGAQQARGPPGGLAAILRDLCKSWFGRCARQFHPDRTGDDGRAMSTINNAREILEELIRDEIRKHESK